MLVLLPSPPNGRCCEVCHPGQATTRNKKAQDATPARVCCRRMMRCHVCVRIMDGLGAVNGHSLAFAQRAVAVDSNIPVTRPCVPFESLPSRFATADAAALREGVRSLRNV